VRGLGGRQRCPPTHPFISVASSWPSPRSSPARSRDAPGTSTDPSCHRVRSPGVTVLRCSHPGARATGVRPRSRLRRRSAQPAAGGRSGGRPDRATGRSARGAEPVVGLDAVPLHEQDEPGPGLHALRHAHRPAAGLEPTSVRASAYAARKAVSAPTSIRATSRTMRAASEDVPSSVELRWRPVDRQATLIRSSWQVAPTVSAASRSSTTATATVVVLADAQHLPRGRS